MDSQSEYEEFFESEIFIHYEYLQKFLLQATEDRSLAGDILQETMARAWEKIELVKEYSNTKYALRIISRNILYNYYKKKAQKKSCFSHMK